MGLKNYALGGVLLLTIGLVAGCAGPRSVSTVFDGSEELQIVVENETHERMTVFALWRAGPRVRLGQVGGGEDVTFTTPVRGPDVRVGVELLSGSRVTYGHDLTVRTDHGIGLEITRLFPFYAVLYRRFRLPVIPPGVETTLSDG